MTGRAGRPIVVSRPKRGATKFRAARRRQMFQPGMITCDYLAQHLHDERLSQAGQNARPKQTRPAAPTRLAWGAQRALRPALLGAGILAAIVLFWLVEVVWAA